jgi:rubrerythrin
MNPVINAEEVLEIAVQIERTGAAFYRRAAKFLNDPETIKLVEELAVMEEGHEIEYENMRADPDTLSALLGDPYGDAAIYLRAMASGRVFPKDADPLADLGADVTPEKIFRKAIILELTSIAFYQGLKDAVVNEIDKRKVDKIIREERGHVTMLSEKLASLII